MIPNQILGIPIIERPAPGDFVARQEHQRHSQLQAAIDALRCSLCGSLNYETTLFVFKTGIEKMTECRNCGAVREECLRDEPGELLAFLPRLISCNAAAEEYL
jgi:hypothetical protein